jgi:60 kDa SS-A/Ro ribonucleoprotein
MTKVGLIAPLSEGAKTVAARLSDGEKIKKSRLHPLSLLVALKTYAAGRGEKSDARWTPVQSVIDALDEAVYTAFSAVEPTGKNFLLALDVSGSMNGGTCSGMTGITPRIGSAVMALATASAESNTHVIGFTGRGYSASRQPMKTGPWAYHPNTGSGVEPLAISKSQRLDSVIKYMDGLPMGPTDCALPMLYAKEQKLPVDVIVVYTDNETYFGTTHPFQALKAYREWSGRNTKLIVVGMTASAFTIADPSDAGSLDIAGFSTDVPAVISAFSE